MTRIDAEAALTAHRDYMRHEWNMGRATREEYEAADLARLAVVDPAAYRYEKQSRAKAFAA